MSPVAVAPERGDLYQPGEDKPAVYPGAGHCPVRDGCEAPGCHTEWMRLGDAESVRESRCLGHMHDSFYTRSLEPVSLRVPGQWQAEEGATAFWNQSCSLYAWNLYCAELAVQLGIAKVCSLLSRRGPRGGWVSTGVPVGSGVLPWALH